MDDAQALAGAETHLIHVLENSDPPREASRYNVTAAARECREVSGTWDLSGVDAGTIEQVLARHPATG